MSRIIRFAVPGFAALFPLMAVAQAPAKLAMMDMMQMGGGMPGAQAQAMQPMQPMQQMPQMQQQMPMGQMPMGQMPMPQPPVAQPSPQMQMPTQQMPMQPQVPMQQMPPQQMAPQQMPMQQGAAGAMGMCPMMAMMMQNMMRMGAMQPGAMQPGMMPGTDAAAPMGVGNSAARLEGRIAYLRTELRITDAQAPAWEAFAAALRSGRDHLEAARESLSGANAAADPMVRLQAYESHLMARTEAVRSTRLAFNTLFAQLDDAQKRAATTTMLPFIGTF